MDEIFVFIPIILLFIYLIFGIFWDPGTNKETKGRKYSEYILALWVIVVFLIGLMKIYLSFFV